MDIIVRNTADESELPSRSVTAFVQSSKSVSLVSSWWKIIHFLLTDSGSFLLRAPSSWSNWEQYVLELFSFLEKAPTEDFVLIPPWAFQSHHHCLWMKTGLWCLVVVHRACPTVSSVPHYCTVSTFHCPS